ncbi:MAG TPA: efflux RND transporter periplasmic adaptor subunit [Bryobacteraceae bacterium]|nr:efflux RND transporter periplasmic adaptor subunit [Bryobacteraceae bacterium]
MRLYASIGILGLALSYWGCSPTYNTQAASRPLAEVERRVADQVVLASPGRVEGRTETIEVGAAIDGLVRTVHVKEGQVVAKDEPLAEIGCPDLQASLQTALSEVESAKQVRARLLRGSREEERLAAEQRTVAAKAVLGQSLVHLSRTTELVRAGTAARSLITEAQRDHDVAEAKLREATRQEELVKAPPMKEDLAKADADVQVAENRVTSVQQHISKCYVKAPIGGTVLRVLLRPGESFSLNAPKPLIMMADLSTRRVRAEVDEKDVTKVAMGQNVIVTSDAVPNRKFRGVVSRLASTMGRKKILSGDPTEKSDRDVLEVMVDLENDGRKLPLGLRVVVQFTAVNPS